MDMLKVFCFSPFSLYRLICVLNCLLLIGAPGLAPGISAPTGYNTPLIPPNFNFNAPVIHFGQTLSGATTISTPQPSLAPATPIARPTFIQEVEGPRDPPTTEDQLHTVFVGDIPDDLSDEWMERITRVHQSISWIPS